MIRKCGKLFALAFVGFLATFTVVSAKEMTVKEIGAAVADEDSSADYAYVIGTHVFSTKHVITTAEFMAAANTIDTTGYNNILDAMAINVIRRTRDASTGAFSDWFVDEPILGDKLADKTNVNYVNLDYTGTSVNTDTVINDELTKLNTSTKNVEIVHENGTITIKVKDASKVTATSVGSVLDTLANDLVDLIKSGSYSVIKLTMSNANTATLEIKLNTSASSIKSALNTLLSTDLKNAKDFTIEFTTAEGVVNESKINKYNVTMVNVIDIDKIFTDNKSVTGSVTSNGYEFRCEEVEGSNCALVVDIKDATKTTGTLADVSKAIEAIAETNGVDYIVLEMGTRITINHKTEASSDVTAAMTTLLSGKTNLAALLNTKMTITVYLDDNKVVSQNNNNLETYELNLLVKLILMKKLKTL